mmetsp:Transcript_60119/g.140517  ORF Transcript_60119/g.140517 Transcript_60119/m.140517 type:complete len:541 (-) Transcript_60119:94-1716(-)
MSDETGLDGIHLETVKEFGGGYVLEPPESVDASVVYRLYRGATGEVNGQAQRVWVDFPTLQLSWAPFDTPARQHCRLSLLDVSTCTAKLPEKASNDKTDLLCMEIWGNRLGRNVREAAERSTNSKHGLPREMPVLAVEATPCAMQGFAEAFENLLASRDKEGKSKLEFIQRSLFQYLWRHQGVRLAENSEQALFEAQAVLSFNLDPKEGVKYLKGKLGKSSSSEVGQWLAQMSTVNGGLDPTLLGNYFSRRDSLEVFKEFVHCLDFSEMNLVVALRKLFDTFKPGGESQVINRILELFAEAYFSQWSRNKDVTLPLTAYAAADSVLATAFSLIMLNTSLHVAAKKAGKSPSASMSASEFVDNTRRVVSEEEVPAVALRRFYSDVKEAEISMQPMPRVAFSRLPVQPDIEGWLIVLLGSDARRFWAVLALQRLYLFSDNSDVDPADACDLKDACAGTILGDADARERFEILQGRSKGKCFCFSRTGRDLPDADMESRAFVVKQKSATWLLQLAHPCSQLVLVAESSDLMEKWVSLIADGPY